MRITAMPRQATVVSFGVHPVKVPELSNRLDAELIGKLRDELPTAVIERHTPRYPDTQLREAYLAIRDDHPLGEMLSNIRHAKPEDLLALVRERLVLTDAHCRVSGQQSILLHPLLAQLVVTHTGRLDNPGSEGRLKPTAEDLFAITSGVLRLEDTARAARLLRAAYPVGSAMHFVADALSQMTLDHGETPSYFQLRKPSHN